MIAFPNCKINLGLNILEKRDDGYHNLETIFYPLALKDMLELISSDDSSKEYELHLSGFSIDTSEHKNLCVQAYQLLKKDFPALPPVKIYLHKTIPLGAGLGGGSADGAFMLMLLNEKFHLHISQQMLMQYALQLGSDCPFFILNQPCFAQQRGEQLTPVEINLSNHSIVLVNPRIHVDTGWAFSQATFSAGSNLQQLMTEPIQNWKEKMTNDFEEPVFNKYPLIQKIKEQLYNIGAIYASMSGSGSTVFGIFSKNTTIDTSVFPSTYFIQVMN
ncbi:MAG: 4-(cytidine 5'-diphospho)-2-C-methyl-D-erythritol kinase [Bacteroidetes bacterium]|nr:4-(cytidine 5'-diphospho)-2-C-methyl-D-erythritol kinase [Bacteroidota bacterium]